MTSDEQFEQVLQDYSTLQNQFEASVAEACGANTELAVLIVAQMRALMKATIGIDRARGESPAFDAYVTAWTTRNGGDPIPAGDGGKYVN